MIYLDPAALLPVIGNVWHRARLAQVPAPGQAITMLCGQTAETAFETLARRSSHGASTQCPDCDLVYRREQGLVVRPNHPGLVPRPQRTTPMS
ncbi:hypothetical protein [Amycolatopsis circi]|uniref:hypothetical protein n=1 Tax=Amycolatopsis circi TaxID=871959 RepID=UPI000E230058|nr:hypothetical protein [Amycolatopsis circi]